MITNATLTIQSGKQTFKIPVTWEEDFFVEGEQLYCDLMFNGVYPVDFEDLELSVILDSDKEVSCQVRWDDMASMVYPARKRK